MRRAICCFILVLLAVTSSSDDLLNQIRNNDLSKLKSLVLRNRIDIDKYNLDGFSLLFYAASSSNSPEIINYLADQGCNVNDQNSKSKITPLMVAARCGVTAETVNALILKGADTKLRDIHGKTALLLTVSSDYMIAPMEIWDFARFAEKKTRPPNLIIEIIETLLSSGSSITEKDSDGDSILHLAAREASNQVLGYLLRKGADINSRDKYGDTPLYHAAGANTSDAVKFFLENGAQVNARNELGTTALFAAAGETPFPDVITLLVKAGLDLNGIGLRGMTNATYAFFINKNLAVLDRILELNPDLTAVDQSGLDIIYFANMNDSLRNTGTYWRLNDLYWQQKERKK